MKFNRDKMIVNRFRKLVTSGDLEALLKKHSTLTPKIPTPVGRVFWHNEEVDGWKLQRNFVFSFWRILNDKNVMQAWGTNDNQLENLLFDRPASVLSNYLDEGFSFSFHPAPTPTGKTVFLIHGWMCRATSMERLARQLAAQGCDVYVYDYETSKFSIDRHAEIFLEEWRKILNRLPKGENIFFVTHSMGGIVLRAALNNMTQEECDWVDGIVQMGPPNRGSLWAIFGRPSFIRRFNASLGDMQKDADSYVNLLPAPKSYPNWGIITATFDDKVRPKDAIPPEGVEFKQISVKCTHLGLCNPKHTLKPILNFIKKGEF